VALVALMSVTTGLDRDKGPFLAMPFLLVGLLASLAGRVEYNLSHMQRNVRLFEIGTVFTAEKSEDTGAPGERIHAAAVIVGDRRPAHFTEPHPPQMDEWDAKNIARILGESAFAEYLESGLDDLVGPVFGASPPFWCN